jgi:hypothetical protein
MKFRDSTLDIWFFKALTALCNMYLTLLKSQLLGTSRASPLRGTDKETRWLNKSRSNTNKDNKNKKIDLPMMGTDFLISK